MQFAARPQCRIRSAHVESVTKAMTSKQRSDERMREKLLTHPLIAPDSSLVFNSPLLC
jgi:hypothetical protein